MINATVNGPACLQVAPDYASEFGDLVGPYGASEDCLQLNVFVPRDVITIGTGMPVLVFVHGGGFFGGSANSVDGSLLVSTATKMVCAPGEPGLRSEQTVCLRVCPVSSGDSRLPVRYSFPGRVMIDTYV